MIFRQIIHEDLGCASYLVGDATAGVAAVVDPRFEIEVYLELARTLGVQITDVFETHNHADHVSGHGRLASATGATIHVHAENQPDFPHAPFGDGASWELGSVRIAALHTPGHRPEHTSFLLSDLRRGDAPWALLAGDSLFVGDVARPDLAVEAHDGARDSFRSLRRLLALPDHVEVWPAHLGGSMCGGPGMDHKVSSTIGFERRHNAMVGIEDPGVFVDTALARLGAQPPNFSAIVALNHGSLITEAPEPARLNPGQLPVLQAAGAIVVDVRTDIQFAAAHVPASVSIPMLKTGFGTKLGWLAAGASRIVFVARDDRDGVTAARLASAVGLGDGAAYLAGGFSAWTAEDRPVSTLERVPVDDLAARLAAAPETQVLDVREHHEWASGHLPGAVCVPWHDVDGVPAGLDGGRPIAVICAAGQRAGIAASVLAATGAERVFHVTDGGVPRWAQLGGALVTEAPAAVS